MPRPSFLRSASSRPPADSSSARSAPPRTLPPCAATDAPQPITARGALGTRATLTSNLSKGLAALAGTAATVGGNVGHYAKAAVRGDPSEAAGEDGSWRDAMAGWVGRKRSNSWVGKDKLVVYPGWAVQRPLQADASPSSSSDDPSALVPFEIRLQLALFASSSRPEAAASRTQRLFTRMARSFADLPRLPPAAAGSAAAGSSRASPARQEGDGPGGQAQFSRELRREETDASAAAAAAEAAAGERRSLSVSPEPYDPAAADESDPRTPKAQARTLEHAGGSRPAIVQHAPTPPPPTPTPDGTPALASAPRTRKQAVPNHRAPSVGSAAAPQLSSFSSLDPFPLSSSASSAATSSSSSSGSSRSSTDPSAASSAAASRSPSRGAAAADDLAALARRGELQQMHATLRARLQPFFATVIPHRPVRVEVRPVRVRAGGRVEPPARAGRDEPAGSNEPLWSRVVTTSVNGTFDTHVVIPWEDIVASPACLDLVFPERLAPPPTAPAAAAAAAAADAVPAPEWALEVTATLLQPDTLEPIADSAQAPWPRATAPLDHGPAATSSVTAVGLDPTLPVGQPPESPLPVTTRTLIPLAGPKGVRVISDLDDTVKRTDLVGGLREVFRNVFCRDVNELEVEGMSALYRSLVPPVRGFHYVSNSPLELFEPIRAFLRAHAFPAGFSLKLKFYGGRSLFHGLWEPAGERKARGVLEILEGFPDAQFLLFGDSAEQDLELYAQIAVERPHQVLGIFIRDVSAQAPQRANTTLSSLTPLDGSTTPTTTSSLSSTTSSSSSSTTASSTSTARSRAGTLERKARALRAGSTSPAGRSRAGSLLRGAGGAPKTTATGHPGLDLAAADELLKQQQQQQQQQSSAHRVLPDGELTASPSASSVDLPGLQSEDSLDPLYAHLPPSPQLTPAIVSAAQDSPAELIDDALSSARAKALRRADDFRARFDRSRTELARRGVVLEKFRRAEEVAELVRDLANGRPLRR